MDQRRDEFLQTLPKILPMVNVNGQLIKQLDIHSRKALVPIVKELDDNQKKVFILTEFNRTTKECDELIQCLRVDGQYKAADYLKKYNERTQPPKKYSDKIELEIKKTKDPKTGGSRYFSMNKYPRGQFILFVNVSSLCQKEGLRFEALFRELFFEVQLYECLSGREMMAKLEEVAKTEYKGDALFVMYVGHGQDEMLIPSWHEDGPVVQNQLWTQSSLANDMFHMKSFVDIFAQKKCHPNFDIIPKVFIFNCCRNKANSAVNTFGQMSGNSNWKDDTIRTFICHSCAEGYNAFYSSDGFTQFGQAFSHAIVEYAYERPLNEIFNKVCQKVNLDTCAMHPQVTMHSVQRLLYLNPGYKC